MPSHEADPVPNAAITAAVIVAAGWSSRMGGVDKIFAPLAGTPVLAHSLAAFESHPRVGEVVIVVRPELMEEGRALVHQLGCRKVSTIVRGGNRRQDSVSSGLRALSEACRWVLVQDGARPCLTAEIIDRGLAAAEKSGAAIAAVPLRDTIKVVGADSAVVETPDRSSLWAVQTPQIFRLDLLRAAYAATTNDVTDDASLVEKSGHPVKVFMGSYDNIKITTPEDLQIAEAFLRRHAEAPK